MGGRPVRVVLASGSPRRRELLEQLGIEFAVRQVDIDETPQRGEDPRAYVRRLALEKSAAAVVEADELVIAADTTVDIGGEIAGKPVDDDDARRMLKALSGRTHRVHTGLAVRCGEDSACEVVTTFVRMAPITSAAIEWYLASGEPFDKAGAYAIQGVGGVLIESVRGSVSNVIGLPLTTLIRLTNTLGIDLLARR